MNTQYMNTDLELEASFDLKPLAAALEARGFWTLSIRQKEEGDWRANLGRRLPSSRMSAQKEEGDWRANLETVVDYKDPEATVSAMLDVIESLDGPLRELWFGCRVRDFDIGYGCGEEPFSFVTGLSSSTILRIAQLNAGVRISLYGLRSLREAEARKQA